METQAQPLEQGIPHSLDCWERLDWMVEEVQMLEQGSLGCLGSQDSRGSVDSRVKLAQLLEQVIQHSQDCWEGRRNNNNHMWERRALE